MNRYTAFKDEQANIELTDSQLACRHEKTNKILVDNTDYIECLNCGHQESESEYTDRKEKNGN